MESKLTEKVNGLMEKYSNSFRFAFLPHFNGVSFRISKSGERGNLQKVKKELDNKVESWLQQSKRKDYNEVPVKELIKSFGELTDMIEAKAGL